VTVLSRCQRFDLRRVDTATLAEHFKRIAAKEGWAAEEDALGLIARATEGSVRDGLSILDQAVAIGGGRVEVAGVRAMLGLADRGRIYNLLEHVLRGAAAPALVEFGKLVQDGSDPVQILSELAEAVHLATRIKVAGIAAAEPMPAEERRRAGSLADRLSLAMLSRTWQMLLKGMEEADKAPDPQAAGDMVLIRIAHTADLPSPDEVIRLLGASGGGARKAAEGGSAPAAGRASDHRAMLGANAASDERQNTSPDPDRASLASSQPRSFTDVVDLAGRHRDARLKVHLEEHVSLVKFDSAGSIDLNLLPGAPPEIANELREKLAKWTGRRWFIASSSEPGAPPLGEAVRSEQAREIEKIKEHPAVKAVLKHFPEASITSIRRSGRSTDDGEAVG
jgi:DNA polymerase-3 subunit gamma/tau